MRACRRIPRYTALGVAWLAVAAAAVSQAASVRVPLTVTEPAGCPRPVAHVTSGVPFPMGTVPSSAGFRLLDEQGHNLPLQAQVTATWRDRSVKWVLLDFQTRLAAGQTRQVTLEAGESLQAAPPPHPQVRVLPQADVLWLDTGAGRVGVRKDRFEVVLSVPGQKPQPRESSQPALDQERLAKLTQSVELFEAGGGRQVRVLPPEEVRVEESGPLRAVVRASGWIDDGATNRLMRYLVRVQVLAGWPGLRLDHTVVQMSPALKMLWVKDISLHLQADWAGSVHYRFGGAPAPHWGVVDQGAVTLAQLHEGAYSLIQGGRTNATGLRAAGWVQVADPHHSLSVGVLDFWQQFPKTITVSSNCIRVGLLPAEAAKPFDFDQGLAKTHRLLVQWDAPWLGTNSATASGSAAAVPSVAPERQASGAAAPVPAQPRPKADARPSEPELLWPPLFAVAPAQWYCQSKVFGDLVPFDFDLFPDYETLVEAGADKLIGAMTTGWRNWGDFYYGGPYKGTNSFMNLEYDLPHNFWVQFARTGLRKYLDAACRMAWHQVDIDVNHYTGWQWKHSPRHTETQAEFGHTFTRGLLETWFLTGERRCLEAALTLGNYFAAELQRPAALGNERQIGWGLISLLPVYEATWDPRYLAAISNTATRLLAGLDARGRFSIRWDNRIAFFNGVAATGLLYLYRATGDEAVAHAALRVIGRTKGFYPDYAGRTLEALAWASQRTGDRDYLDLLKLTYETTMAQALSWGGLDPGAMTIFTVHALPFIQHVGLARKPAQPLNLTPHQYASDYGLHAHHLPHAQAELYLRCPDDHGFRLILVRKGAWKGPGDATLWGPTGQVVARLEFPQQATVFQRQELAVARSVSGTYRLTLQAPVVPGQRTGSMISWDVVSSEPMPAVFSLPGFAGLERVRPRLITAADTDAARIELDLRAEGEGFKKAVLYDPAGQPAAVLERFVDLDDENRYSYKLAADIPAEHRAGLWSLELQDVAVVRLTGLVPYFATSPKAFFRPDHAP